MIQEVVKIVSLGIKYGSIWYILLKLRLDNIFLKTIYNSICVVLCEHITTVAERGILDNILGSYDRGVEWASCLNPIDPSPNTAGTPSHITEQCRSITRLQC